ncbi:MAG: aromatic amino acid transaminase [Granulosicoccus sp.]
MFESLPESKPDAILALMAMFREDTRATKMDLGVGIYKDAHGKTPIMRAGKSAEEQLLATQDTKAYVSPAGSAPFCAAMIKQVFGEDADFSRLRAAQSVGGSGALRVLAELIRQTRPNAQLWLSNPTWPNHRPLLGAAGFALNEYPYYDVSSSRVDSGAMLDTLGKASEGDIVLLHGCCHNPSGADLTLEQWSEVIDLLESRNLFPFVDLAYQGFGDGMEEDAAAIRLMASRLPEMAVAASCSKNLGLYRERVGAAILLAENEADANRAHGSLVGVIRSNYSMPPDHGANASNLVLSNPQLNSEWRTELEDMRLRMVRLRNEFSEAMRKRSNSDRFDFIAQQKGMFSRLPLNPEQIARLRDEHALYIVGDGRINVAGLPDSGMEELADVLCSVINDEDS